MKCPFCSNEIDENLNFCSVCGKKISHCEKCGKPILYKANICGSCGASLDPSQILGLSEYHMTEEEKEALKKRQEEEIKRQKEIARKREELEKEKLVLEQLKEEERKRKNKALIKYACVGFLVICWLYGLSNVLPLFREMGSSGGTAEEALNDNSAVVTEQEAPTITTITDNSAEREAAARKAAIEKKITSIREKYNTIVTAYDKGKYKEFQVQNGVSACYSGDELKMIIARKGVDNSSYTRSYYYDNNELIFAYYEGSDAFRFYYDDEDLIRIRYAEYATNNDNAVDYDDADSWNSWPETVNGDNRKLVSIANQTKTYFDASAGEYMLPYSNVTYLSKSDLKGFSKEQCRIARNEIFARHGRMFDDSVLQNYFNSKNWYIGTTPPTSFNEDVLNRYEKKNIDLIVGYEKAKGYR